MKLKQLIVLAVALAPLVPATALRAAPYQMENLGRGVVAVRTGSSSVYVGWRLLGLDPSGIAFNVYRGSTKINGSPIASSTNLVDTGANLGVANTYTVRPVINGVEQAASAGYTLPANAPTRQYLNVPLQIPAGGTTPDGVNFTYSAGDASVGDLDGDGEYEIVLKWDPSNAKDNSQSGYTGNVIIDAYKLNGTRLWRINLGRNIRAGAHYTQFMVYDFDGDGKAEMMCKTADGTTDGTGVVIGSSSADYRNSSGYVLSGPEFLTVFNGQTGKAMATANYTPARGSVGSWGDTYGNRVDRFTACVAYLDGTRPSAVFGRGYYTRLVRSAWDWRNGALTQRWIFDSNNSGNGAYAGQGNHQLTVGDVDGDGKQEVVNGSSAIDDNGTGLYANGLGHGDAMHMSVFDPSRSGQEVWQCHEDPGSYGSKGEEFRDGKTGVPIWGYTGSGGDIGRCAAGDVDPNYPGAEVWGPRGGLFTNKGVIISSSTPPVNFMVWWDADLLREGLDGTTISKWNYTNKVNSTLFAPSGVSSINSTKANPCLSADILGDWREEVIWRASDNSALRIYTTTIVASNRFYTLMHDAQYRVAIAWQNCAYNQPPWPSFFLGNGMAAQPAASITYVGGTQPPPPSGTYQGESATIAGGVTVDSNNAGFNGTGFLNFPLSGGTATFTNVDGNGGGSKSLAIRYANGTTSSRTGNLVVNGTSVPITFAPTGSWTTWLTMNVNITLNNTATNTIQLGSTGADLGNIDQITVP
ncbi:MAG TPA: rhamnogalacturonan lyase [Opitutaceae bacterium]|nr:rhamnogalacturonan lyase [Opitutaceae bacterium]